MSVPSPLKKLKALQPVSCDVRLPVDGRVLCAGAKEIGHRTGCVPTGTGWNKAGLIKATDLGREKTSEMPGGNRG